MILQSKKRLLVAGASGHAKVVIDMAEQLGYSEILVFDDDESITACLGYPVAGRIDDMLLSNGWADYIVAIGNAKVRRNVIERIDGANSRLHLATLVHPKAYVSKRAYIGPGSVVMAGAVANAGACLAEACIVNTSASVDHDCNLGAYVHVAVGANIAGSVAIGSDTWVGAGAVVNNNLTICEGCTIGSGAVVVRDIEVSGTYIGVPARLIETSSPIPS